MKINDIIEKKMDAVIRVDINMIYQCRPILELLDNALFNDTKYNTLGRELSIYKESSFNENLNKHNK